MAWADILLPAKSAFPTSLWVMQEVEQCRSLPSDSVTRHLATVVRLRYRKPDLQMTDYS